MGVCGTVRFPGPVFGVVFVILLVLGSGCIGDIRSKAGVGTFGGSPSSTDSSTFTCDYDENHMKTSPEFSGWFNTSCYYNEHCGWWESVDQLPKPTPTIDCVNCSYDTWLSLQPPTPVPTPCQVRAGKAGGSTPLKPTTGSSDSVLPDGENRMVSVTIDCTMKKEEVLTGETDTRIVKIKGDVPFMMAKNWDKKPLIDGLQVYGSTLSGEGAKLDLSSEWNHACTSDKCVPCHYKYSGPVWIGATIMHDPKDVPSDWQVILLPSGETTNALGSGDLLQYTKNLEPACPLSPELATPTLVTSVSGCFAAGNWKHFTLNDGIEIIFTTSEPNVALDSKAVFHNGG
jgi:hypothetical protein